MRATVVYESVYGNTRAVAEAIAEGLGGASVVPVCEAGGSVAGADLLVVGGPTHMHGLSTTRSRQAAAAAEEEKSLALDPGATAEVGLRGWLHDLAEVPAGRAASFDTRLDRSPWVTGVASRGIAKRLRRHGYRVLASESFLVEESEGPLEDGELERARAWGSKLAEACAAPEAQVGSGA